MATATLLLILSVVIGLFVLIWLLPKGPQEDKRKKDGTYSTHNYKQPNKAAVARQWETPLSVAVPPIETTQPPAGNYKHHSGQDTNSGQLTGPAPTPAPLQDRHYKTKHWLQTDFKAATGAKKKPTEDQPATDE